MILLAESGSTKCTWVVLDENDGTVHYKTETAGINPCIVRKEDIFSFLEENISPITKTYLPKRIFFYGAGCTPEASPSLAEAITKVTKVASVEVASDMVAAIRATIGKGKGIVCILGTGSNSCYCEAGRSVKATPALGYILGDEAGGAYLGRRLVGDVLKGVAPDYICRSFRETFALSNAEIIEKVYRGDAPNRFLASLAPFLSAHIGDGYVRNLVYEAFLAFVERNLTDYPTDADVWAVGSVAWHFRPLLEEALSISGRRLAGVVKNPIDGLIKYHSKSQTAPTKKCSEEATGKTRAFRKISEEESHYDDLEKKSVREVLEAIHCEDSRVAKAVGKNLDAIERLVEGLIERMKQGGRLFYIGAGTSGRLGVLDASEIPPTFGMPPTVVIGLIAGGDRALRNPVEGAEDNLEQGWLDLVAHDITPLDTVVGIAASGTTPYVIGAIERAREAGCLTASVASNPASPLALAAEINIETVVGPEVVTGSSRMKSGTAQKMVCNMITTSTMIGLGRVRGNRMVNMQLSNKKLIDRGTRMLMKMLDLPYDRAQALLLLHGSVQRALTAKK